MIHVSDNLYSVNLHLLTGRQALNAPVKEPCDYMLDDSSSSSNTDGVRCWICIGIDGSVPVINPETRGII